MIKLFTAEQFTEVLVLMIFFPVLLMMPLVISLQHFSSTFWDTVIFIAVGLPISSYLKEWHDVFSRTHQKDTRVLVGARAAIIAVYMIWLVTAFYLPFGRS